MGIRKSRAPLRYRTAGWFGFENLAPALPVAIPPMPFALDDVARAEWERISQLLYKHQLINELDGVLLGIYCDAYSVWKRACHEIAQIALKKGSGNANALKEWIWVRKDSERSLHKYARHLALKKLGELKL